MGALTATTLAVTSLVGTAVSTGISYYGYRQQAETSKRVADYNAKVRQNQAIQQEMEANESIRRRRKEQRAFLGRQRAKFGAAGVDVQGTPLLVMAESAATMELQNADKYRQSQTAKTSLFSQAGMDLMAGQASASAARMQGFGTLLTGATGMADQTLNYRDQGIFK